MRLLILIIELLIQMPCLFINLQPLLGVWISCEPEWTLIVIMMADSTSTECCQLAASTQRAPASRLDNRQNKLFWPSPAVPCVPPPADTPPQGRHEPLHHHVSRAGGMSARQRLLLHLPATQLQKDRVLQLPGHQLLQVSVDSGAVPPWGRHHYCMCSLCSSFHLVAAC